ncbi:MAG: FlgO family outer membrane protein [Succinivibrio sp.]
MERKILKMMSFTAAVLLAGCTANPASDGNEAKKAEQVTVTAAPSIYNQKGMEISKIVSEMSDVLYSTMMNDLKKSASVSVDSEGNKTVSYDPLPKVAVTSFVDTDTYENAGYLGRSMAEMFIHELDRRGIGVFEYKLTGAISITKDGEMVFSRNWKKLARQAMVKHIFAGTLTRNDRGIVVVGRVINMSNQTVVGSATGFIPYELLPYCYRTGKKDCALNGVSSYRYESGGNLVPEGAKTGIVDTITSKKVTVVTKNTPAASSVSTKGSGNIYYDPDSDYAKKARKANELRFKDNYYYTDTKTFNDKYYISGAKVPATSTGNYEYYMYTKEKSFWGNSFGKEPVIYPADTYEYQGKLVRDVHDQSQYSRTSK